MAIFEGNPPIGHFIGEPVHVLRQSADGKGRGPWRVDALWPSKAVGEIDTWGVDEGTALLLEGLIASMQPSVVLETGTHKGRSTYAMAKALGPLGHITTVDMDDYEIKESGTIPPQWADKVTTVVGKTPEILDSLEIKDIDFAFLDGDHTPEGVLAEIEFVRARRSKAGVVIAIDNVRDVGWPGLEKALSKYDPVTLPTMTGLALIDFQEEL